MSSLLTCQNPDGGWPYQPGGSSWTEPTAYAALALSIDPSAAPQVAAALRWLAAHQLADGGWPPQPGVHQSTTVTALVALLGPAALGEASYRRGIQWLLRQTGSDTGLLNRLRLIAYGRYPSQPAAGWPWFPGTSAWVIPTSLSILALRKTMRLMPGPAIRERLDQGEAFLLQHACADGGWNYGTAESFGYTARSYPETTGMALLALQPAVARVIGRACALARAQLRACQSSEAESWLRLGLAAHAQLPLHATPPVRPARDVRTAALAMLASAAAQGRHVFLD